MNDVCTSNPRRTLLLLPCVSKHYRSHNFLSTTWTLIILSILICCVSTTTALEVAMPVQTALDLASFANSGILLVDQRPHPSNKESIHDDLRRRDDSTTATASTTLSSATASTTLATSTLTISSTTTLPSPFDSSLGNNFTDSLCPEFITSLISTDLFQSCLPFSLLLQVSKSQKHRKS